MPVSVFGCPHSCIQRLGRRDYARHMRGERYAVAFGFVAGRQKYVAVVSGAHPDDVECSACTLQDLGSYFLRADQRDVRRA